MFRDRLSMERSFSEDSTEFHLSGGSRYSSSSTSRKSLTDALATIKDEGEESWNEKQDEKQALLEGYKGEDMLDPYFIGNRGIFASYIAVGFCIYFTVTPITFYLVDDMDANAAQVAVVIGLMSLPWALKLVCGFISDSFPIYGLRRKPYYAIGWASYIICNLILVVLRKPSIGPLAAFVFLMTFSFVQADVCTDAMIVERSKAFETQETRGTLQAQGYIARFFSGVFGAVLGATLYNKDDWGWGLPIWAIFLVNAAVPACLVIPNFFSIVEMNSEVPPKLQIQVAAIWKLLLDERYGSQRPSFSCTTCWCFKIHLGTIF